MTDTIPKASNQSFGLALQGIMMQAKAHGVDTSTMEMNKFLNHIAEVVAQQDAEIMWLRFNDINKMMQKMVDNQSK